MTIKVKTLKWDNDKADTPFGQYKIVRTNDGYQLFFEEEENIHVGFNSCDEPYHDTRAYAQVDYAARILSAIEVEE